MSTTTASVALATPPSRLARASLLWLVFSCGVGVMGLEMTASQLIKPYFGSTISVWTSLIGLVMIFLTAGYSLGGALADRRPTRGALGGIVLVAGVLVTLLPLASVPILRWAWDLTPKLGLLGGSLVGIFVLFSLPNLLLGCVCPFAMKLSLQDLARTGRAAGNIYAVSAVGSVLGTFLPVLLLIPALGVRRSIMLLGVVLIVAALLLLRRARYLPALAVAGLLALHLPPLLPVKGVIAERESQYNYLQVVQQELAPGVKARFMITDWGIHSLTVPGVFRTGQYYDYLLLAPLTRPDPPKQWLTRVLIIGLAAGTVAKQITEAYGPVEIDGVEIDPAIVDLGRRYFAMNEPNLHVYTTDGRAFLAASTEPYDWIIVDAYQGSEIPSHLITLEFFRQLKEHLTPNGVLSLNLAWWEPNDQELLQRLVATVAPVFPRSYAVTGISANSGAVLLAGSEAVTPAQLITRASRVGHPDLLQIAQEMGDAQPPQLVVPTPLGPSLTDDQGLVNNIVDRMYRASREAATRHQREQMVLGG